MCDILVPSLPGRCDLVLATCKAPKQEKALTTLSGFTESRDGCRRSGSILVKYTDLPESTELHRAIQCPRDMDCQEENPFTCQSTKPGCPSVRSRWASPPCRAAGLLASRNAGYLLVLIPAGTLLRFPAIPDDFGHPGLRLFIPHASPETAPFLRAMEEDSFTSPLFGILVLKRLS